MLDRSAAGPWPGRTPAAGPRSLLAAALGLVTLAGLTTTAALAAPAPGAGGNAGHPGATDLAVDLATAPVTELVLTPRWRLGGEEDGDVFFGVIAGVARDADGRFLIADGQLTTVTVVAADGTVAGTVGRQGEGPGEVTRLGGVLALPGGTVGLVQLMPGKVVLIDRAGLPAGEIVPRWAVDGGRLLLADVRRAGDQLVAAGRRMVRGDTGVSIDLWIAPLAGDGTVGTPHWHERRAFDPRTGTRDERLLDWAGDGRWTALADGTVVLAADREDYVLAVHRPDGTARTVVVSGFAPVARTAGEKAALQQQLAARGGGPGGGRRRPPDLAFTVADHEPAVRAVHAVGADEVWVLSSRGDRDQPPGVLQTWEIFDPRGNLLRRTAVRCEGQASRDRLVPLGDGWFVLIRGLETADGGLEATPLEIVGLRVAD